MKKIRWGIVGPGEIANKFAKAIKNVKEASLVAVASRTEDKGKAFAEKYNIEKVFCGYEAMAESDAVDAVYIATPHPFHKPCAELFLNFGKHVLCEKPLCVNAKEAEALSICAGKNNVFLMEAMWTRFIPSIIKVQEIVRSGVIGEVRGIDASFCYASSIEEEAKLFQNDMAGGSLLDVGVYGLHFVSLFLGNNPISVSAEAIVEDGCDCITNVLLRYERGAIASVSSATKLQKPADAYIYGTKGHIYLPHFYGAQEFFVRCGEEETKITAPSLGDGFEEEIIEACSCIEHGKLESKMLPHAESIAMLRLMDNIREKIGVKYPFD